MIRRFYLALVVPVRSLLGQDRMMDWFFALYWAMRRLTYRIIHLRSEAPKARIAIISMWDQGQAGLGAITGPNKAVYCQIHGYDWLPQTTGFITDRPIAWSKVHFLRQILPHYDWVMWSDADSLIMNPTIRLEEFIKTPANLVITRDHHGINSGSFLLRRCDWSHRFLDTLWVCPETISYQKHYGLWTDRLWENRAFWLVLNQYEYRRHTAIVPQRRLNSYARGLHPGDDAADYQPGDFILHLPGVPDIQRVSVLRSAAALVNQTPLV